MEGVQGGGITLPTITAHHGAPSDPKSPSSFSRGRSARSPVRQGPMAPTAHLSAAVTTGAPAPQSMAPAPARRVMCLLPHPIPSNVHTEVAQVGCQLPTHPHAESGSLLCQVPAKETHAQDINSRNVIKGIHYQGVRSAEEICKGM